MISRSQNVQVNPIAFMAAQIGVSTAAPTSFVNNQGLDAGIADTSKGLGKITALKSELKASLDSNSGQSSPSSPSESGGSWISDMALAGVSIALGDPAGAVAGVARGISKMGASFTHQGTINFGEKGVQGGELAQGFQSQENPRGGYVDVMGGAWDAQSGQAIKVSSAVVPPAPKSKLDNAIGAAREMFSRDQLEDAVYSAGKQEKALIVAHNGMEKRLDRMGIDVEFKGGVEDYNAFNDSLQNKPRPKPLTVGMGAPATPAPFGLG